jgi:hypothetical protein
MHLSRSLTAVACLAVLIAHVAEAAPPANDNFASAITIGSTPYTDSKSTVEATDQSGEPAASGTCNGSYGIWYRYTAPSTGSVVASTTGSSFDTVLSVFTGSTVSTLFTHACNDDYGSLQSRMPFSVVAGTTYYIRVNGYSGGRGSVQFQLSSVAAPLFTQCPAIGSNSGCLHLVTAESDGTFTVATDTNQGPYPHGPLGRLFGVQNDSGEELCGVNVRVSNGFAFGTYGLCSSGVSPQPAMCPFGETLYEGPGVTFDAVNAHYGTASFEPCIPAGGSAYFSLAGYPSPSVVVYGCAEDESCGPDADTDGIIDDLDNCPSQVNPDQANLDGDTQGDRCDSVDNTLTLKGSIKHKADDGRAAMIKGRITQSETISDSPDATGGFQVTVHDEAYSLMEVTFDAVECVADTKKIVCEKLDETASLKIPLGGLERGKVPFKLKMTDLSAPPPLFIGPIRVVISEPDTYVEREGSSSTECVAKPTQLTCK